MNHKPLSPREIAEKIGDKAADGETYVEDGGYIRDWLVNDIETALKSYGSEQRKKGFEEGIKKAANVIPSCERQMTNPKPKARSKKLFSPREIAENLAYTIGMPAYRKYMEKVIKLYGSQREKRGFEKGIKKCNEYWASQGCVIDTKLLLPNRKGKKCFGKKF